MRDRLVVVALLLLFLGGCASAPHPTRYYSLAAPAASVDAGSEVRLGVGPITLPERLDRREVVVRSAPQQLEPLPFDLWSGNLREEILHRLGQRLAAELGTTQLHFFPLRGVAVEYQVQVEILELIATPGEEAELLALWQLRGSARTPPQMRRSHYRQPLPDATVPTLVEHYGQLLDRLAATIAEAIREAAPDTP